MTRQTSTFSDLRDDEPYLAVLVSAKVVPSKKEGWAPQIEVDWELRQGGKLRDWLPSWLNTKAKGPSTLRQLLNAIAEKPKDTDLWFDPDTLDWGYDLEKPDAAPYANLFKCVGLPVQFRGEAVKGKDGVLRYRINAYRAAPGGKPKAPTEPIPVDVDPAEIPF